MEKKQLNSLPPLTLAYIAGLIDGEGTITIRRNNRGKAGAFEEYAAMISMAQKDRAILDWLRDQLGCGSVVEHQVWKDEVSGRQTWQMHHWAVSARLAAQLIEALLPYLRIKRAQAEIVLAFQTAKNDWQSQKRVKGRRGTLPTPDDLMDKYRAWCIEVQTLNGRKVIHTGPRIQKE